MGTDQIMYCIVALILGMLMFHMLKNVCGCKTVVEGSFSSDIKSDWKYVFEGKPDTRPDSDTNPIIPPDHYPERTSAPDCKNTLIGCRCNSMNDCGKSRTRCVGGGDFPGINHINEKYCIGDKCPGGGTDCSRGSIPAYHEGDVGT